MSVSQLLNSMDSYELSQWIIFYGLDNDEDEKPPVKDTRAIQGEAELRASFEILRNNHGS